MARAESGHKVVKTHKIECQECDYNEGGQKYKRTFALALAKLHTKSEEHKVKILKVPNPKVVSAELHGQKANNQTESKNED